MQEGCRKSAKPSGGESAETISHTTAWKSQNHFYVQTAYLVFGLIIRFDPSSGNLWTAYVEGDDGWGRVSVYEAKEAVGEEGTLKMSCDWWLLVVSGPVSTDVFQEFVEIAAFFWPETVAISSACEAAFRLHVRGGFFSAFLCSFFNTNCPFGFECYIQLLSAEAGAQTKFLEMIENSN